MKQCAKCGVEKSESEFYKNDGRLRSYCKSCLLSYNKNHVDILKHKAAYRIGRDRWKKKYACAKIFCEKLPQDEIIACFCRYCGKIYGLTKERFFERMRGDPRYYPKYCSRECQRKSLSNKNSPYAKKIKELQLVYK